MNSTRGVLSAILLTAAAVGEIILTFVLYDETANSLLRNAGWIVLWVSALFGWLPILTLRKWGSVPQGESYVHTTELVDRGVYGIVRHPQYLAGILLGLGLAMISQDCLVAVLGAIVALLCYADTYEEERRCKAKFGEAYRHYSERVPRLNFVAGLLRQLRRRH